MKTSEPQPSDLDSHGSASLDSSRTSEPQPSALNNYGSASLDSAKPRRPGRTWRWLLVALLLLGGGAAVWLLLKPKSEAPSAEQAQPQGTRVKVLQLETVTTADSSDFLASLESRRSVTLQPRIEGQISRILVNSGDEVTAGTAIIQVAPDERQAAVNSTVAAVAAAQAEVVNAQATLKSLEAERLSRVSDVQYNQKEYERYSRLADQGAVARRFGDEYTNNIQTARAALATTNANIQAQRAAVVQAQRAVQEAQANVKEQQAQLQYFRITAPFAGTVGDIPVKVGDFVDTDTQLTTITQNRPLEVQVSVPIERGPQLRTGMTVELLDAQNRSLGDSRIFFIAPNTANATQSILIKSLFDNARGQLRADQYVQARVIWSRRPGVLIPTTAVTRLGGETFVFVAEMQQPSQQAQPAPSQLVARQKLVKLGPIQGNNYQVLAGLKPGERIVTSGLLNLRDSAVIIPE